MDQDFDVEEEEEMDASLTHTPGSILGKRKSFPAADGVTIKTLMRWKVTGSVCVDHLLGFCPDSTPEESAKAEELLVKTGLLVCCLCNMSVAANKKSVKRHQTKNRRHLNYAVNLAAGQVELDPVAAMGVANNLLASESRMTLADHQAIAVKLPRATTGPSGALNSAGGLQSGRATHSASLSEEAWEIINHDGKVINRAQLTSLLQSLGVYEGKDLFYCDPKEINEIAKLLKKVPQRRFQQIFGIEGTNNGQNSTPSLLEI